MWSHLSKSKTRVFGAATIVVVAVIALTVPLLGSVNSNGRNTMGKLQNPAWAGGTWGHLSGADKLGYDVFSRILYGNYATLLVSLTGTAVADVVGVLLGLMSGYKGGWAGAVIIRSVDVQLVFPFTLPALFIVTVFGPGLNSATLIAGPGGWVSCAQLVREGVPLIKGSEYMETLCSTDAGDIQIVLKYILPGVISPATVIVTLSMA